MTVDEEKQRILDHYGKESFETLSVMLDRQFQMLQARSNALLVVCGLLLAGNSYLGYAYPKINHQSFGPLFCRVAGGAFAVASAATVVIGVMKLEWITQYPGKTTEEWLHYALEFRNRKTRAFRVSSLLALISILCFEFAILSFIFVSRHWT